LFGCPIHTKKNSNTSYIPVGDPSTETTTSRGHHKKASHTCGIQTYSVAALGFCRFLLCGQGVWLEWMDVVSIMHQQFSNSVSKSL
jgi:hypothetical protein